MPNDRNPRNNGPRGQRNAHSNERGSGLLNSLARATLVTAQANLALNQTNLVRAQTASRGRGVHRGHRGRYAEPPAYDHYEPDDDDMPPLVHLNLNDQEPQFLGIHLGPDEDEDVVYPLREPAPPREPVSIPLPANPAPMPAPPLPQIDLDVLREMEYYVDLLTERAGESLQSVDRLNKAVRDMEDQLGRTQRRLALLDQELSEASSTLLNSKNSTEASTLRSNRPARNNSSARPRYAASSPIAPALDPLPTSLSEYLTLETLPLPPTEPCLTPSDFRLGSSTSRFLENLWSIISYERSMISASEDLSHPQPPPRPSEATYRRVATLARLADSLFPAASKRSPSPTLNETPLSSAPLDLPLPMSRCTTPEAAPTLNKSPTRRNSPSWEDLKEKAARLIRKGKGKAIQPRCRSEEEEAKEEQEME